MEETCVHTGADFKLMWITLTAWSSPLQYPDERVLLCVLWVKAVVLGYTQGRKDILQGFHISILFGISDLKLPNFSSWHLILCSFLLYSAIQLDQASAGTESRFSKPL